jgi:hypothetical protein
MKYNYVKFVLGISVFLLILGIVIINVTPGYFQNNPCGCGMLYITDSESQKLRSKECPRLMFECGRDNNTINFSILIRQISNTLDFNK